MIKLAFYGKGGIGKSTAASNVSVALAQKGLKVMQIGCDPKADSTVFLHGGERIPTVLDLVRKGESFDLEDMVRVGYNGVVCVEAGGPVPGLGCAGRGIIAALEELEKKGAYEKYQPDVVIYDVLGDVVCGGFSMPMRKGYADKVFIAMAVENFKSRGYASLGGFILNKRNVKNEEEKAAELAADFHSSVIAEIDRSDLVSEAEDMHKTVMEAFPDSTAAEQYRALADKIAELCGMGEEK